MNFQSSPLPKFGPSLLINARSETVREKRSFKAAFAGRRCLAIADGFYEWKRPERDPYLFTVAGGAPFAIAAIWEPGQEFSRSCLLTTAANSVLAPIHDRMPVIVAREHWPAWFAEGELPPKIFTRIAAPYPADQMSSIPVSRIVNSSRNNDPRCSEPPGDEPPLPTRPKKKETPPEPDLFGTPPNSA